MKKKVKIGLKRGFPKVPCSYSNDDRILYRNKYITLFVCIS